jgi:hypothetical protein
MISTDVLERRKIRKKAIVEAVKPLLAEGCCTAEIGRRLNDLAIPSPTGKEWSYFNISKFLAAHREELRA